MSFAVGKDVVLGYDRREAVTASSFEIPAGVVTAVIGPNGSGKSTLLHALAGIVPLRGGSLQVRGCAPGEGARELGYVMQTVSFAPGTPITVSEVVGMGRYSSLGWWKPRRARDRARVAAAMEQLNVRDLAGRHLCELSGGQRQRVFVAQALAQDHEALLLDEPLTGLDLVSARIIDEIIHNERHLGHTVVLTTHDLEEAHAADNVILMSGKVVACGPPSAVLTRANLAAAYGLGALHDAGAVQFVDDPTGHPDAQN